MKILVAGASALAAVVVVAAATIAYSQQTAAPKPGQATQLPGQAQTPGQAPGQAPGQVAPSCLTQYTPMPGQSAITMIKAGYEIKAAVPNGLWLQKDKDVYYCNSGRPIETDAQCWRLRDITRC
jgi:hypothetical protein